MTLIQADVLEWVQQNKTPLYHAVLSDPPYFLGSITKRFGAEDAAPAQYGKDGAFQRQSKGFMGKTWDGFESVRHYQAWVTEWAGGLLDSVYPGALGFFFGGTRTYHRLACGIEDAGWEIIDQIQYMYGSGFPKSHNVEDHGTALKPAFEPVIVARAPRGKYTFAQLYAEFGTGLFNIDGARIDTNGEQPRGSGNGSSVSLYGQVNYSNGNGGNETSPLGRWPANIILDEEAAAALDEMSGELKNGGENADSQSVYGLFGERKPQRNGTQYAGDSGGASRFFYTAKASAWEREAGLDGFDKKLRSAMAGRRDSHDMSEYKIDNDVTGRFVTERRNTHPTLKPISLTEYLARLLLPPAHITERRLLVPFGGVGSEMIGGMLAGWEVVDGIERESEYVAQGQARLKWWSQYKSYEQAKSAYKGEQRENGLKQMGQLSMFDEV